MVLGPIRGSVFGRGWGSLGDMLFRFMKYFTVGVLRSSQSNLPIETVVKRLVKCGDEVLRTVVGFEHPAPVKKSQAVRSYRNALVNNPGLVLYGGIGTKTLNRGSKSYSKNGGTVQPNKEDLRKYQAKAARNSKEEKEDLANSKRGVEGGLGQLANTGNITRKDVVHKARAEVAPVAAPAPANVAAIAAENVEEMPEYGPDNPNTIAGDFRCSEDYDDAFYSEMEMQWLVSGYEERGMPNMWAKDVCAEAGFLFHEGGMDSMVAEASDRRVRNFVCAGNPNLKSVHDNDNFEGKLVVDCHGAPYCGVVCVDLAVGRKPNAKEYELMAGPCYDDELVINHIGNSDFLIQYAAMRGYNLGVRTHVLGEEQWVKTPLPNPGWKWVLLDHTNVGLGHYRLLVNPSSDGNNFVAPVPIVRRKGLLFHSIRVLVGLIGYKMFQHGFASLLARVFFRTWQGRLAAQLCFFAGSFMSFSSEFVPKFELSGVYLSPNNDDRRTIVDRRDKVVSQDSYCEVTRTYELVMFGWSRFSFSFKFAHAFGYSDKWLISIARANLIAQEMQTLAATGRDTHLAIAGINRLREVNTDSNINSILLSTANYMKVYGSSLGCSTHLSDTVGLVAYNADPRAIPAVDLVPVAVNQLVGGFTQCNHVKRVTLSAPKRKVPVAVACIGALRTNCGILGPGLMCVTDSHSVFSAVVLRGMSKDMFDKELTSDFVEFSKRFMDKEIQSVNVELVERDIYEYYEERNKGKKPYGVIQSDISDHKKFIAGEMTAKEAAKYVKGKIFTKFESNVKAKDGKYWSKPRGIMMMSPKATMELAQFCSIYDCWNEGSFGRFQVKHMTVDEVIAKVSLATDKPHFVTDYSSFESSITASVRAIEIHVMKSLLLKFGFSRLLRDYEDFESRGFDLAYSPSSYVFNSRCSGHYWTSFANGIVNVCVAAYCCHRNGTRLEIVAEGDDGIVPSENLDIPLAKSIGFELSSEMSGTRPADNDFLRSRWVDGRRYVNVGRALNLFWVKKAAGLRVGKQKYLLKCAAMSLANISPGHPVLWAACRRIFHMTKHTKDFTGSDSYLNKWGIGKADSYSGVKFDVQCCEEMREVVARGGNGFPPISIGVQLELEGRFLDFANEVYIGNLLDDYTEIMDNVWSHEESPKLGRDVDEFRKVVEVVSNPVRYCLDNIEVVGEYMNKTEQGSELFEEIFGESKGYERLVSAQSNVVTLLPGWDSPW